MKWINEMSQFQRNKGKKGRGDFETQSTLDTIARSNYYLVLLQGAGRWAGGKAVSSRKHINCQTKSQKGEQPPYMS